MANVSRPYRSNTDADASCFGVKSNRMSPGQSAAKERSALSGRSFRRMQELDWPSPSQFHQPGNFYQMIVNSFRLLAAKVYHEPVDPDVRILLHSVDRH